MRTQGGFERLRRFENFDGQMAEGLCGHTQESLAVLLGYFKHKSKGLGVIVPADVQATHLPIDPVEDVPLLIGQVVGFADLHQAMDSGNRDVLKLHELLHELGKLFQSLLLIELVRLSARR
jgi:hypothetical protein